MQKRAQLKTLRTCVWMARPKMRAYPGQNLSGRNKTMGTSPHTRPPPPPVAQWPSPHPQPWGRTSATRRTRMFRGSGRAFHTWTYSGPSVWRGWGRRRRAFPSASLSNASSVWSAPYFLSENRAGKLGMVEGSPLGSLHAHSRACGLHIISVNCVHKQVVTEAPARRGRAWRHAPGLRTRCPPSPRRAGSRGRCSRC